MSLLEEKVNELEAKMSDIAVRLSDYQQVINHIKNENKALHHQLSVAEMENSECKKKQQVLGLMQSVLQKEDKAELKKEINKLVREIDFCIGYINSK